MTSFSINRISETIYINPTFRAQLCSGTQESYVNKYFP